MNSSLVNVVSNFFFFFGSIFQLTSTQKRGDTVWRMVPMMLPPPMPPRDTMLPAITACVEGPT